MLAVTSFLCSSDSLIQMEKRFQAVWILPQPGRAAPDVPSAASAAPRPGWAAPLGSGPAALAFQPSPSSPTDFLGRSQKSHILVALNTVYSIV